VADSDMNKGIQLERDCQPVRIMGKGVRHA